MPTAEKVRVSILERLVPMIAFALAAIGGGASAFMLQQMFSALQFVEANGVAAVAGGTAEANYPVMAGLFLGILVGFVALGTAVLRMFVAKKRSSPPGLFYLLPGLLSLFPVALVWYAESLIIDALVGVSSSTGGISAVGGTIQMLLFGAMISVPIILLILGVLVFAPFTARPGGKTGPTIALLIMGFLFIAAAMAFQYRTIYLYHIREERGAVPSVALHT